MNEIQRTDGYESNQVIQYEGFRDEQPSSALNVFMVIYRRWKMVLMIALIICAVTIPVVWLAGKQYYESEGAIRVTPVVSPILFRDLESDRPMPNYEHFVNTQASLMASNNVLNRVADELAGKDLEFFEDTEDLAIALKLAIKRENILIEPVRLTELVKLSMATSNSREAELIINTFIRAYMATIASDEVRGGDQKLAVLEEKRRVILEQIDRQQEEIRRLAEEYGTVALSSRQDMMLQQVVSLQNELTSIEVKRLSLEASANMKESDSTEVLRPGELIQMRNEFLNSDLVYQQLSTDVAEQESLVMELQQVMSPENSRFKRQASVLASLKESLDVRRYEMTRKFDEEFQSAVMSNQSLHLADIKSELKRTVEYEARLRERLDKANSETVRMGRKQLMINNLQEKLLRVKETYDAVNQRIDELEMERKRQTRVSVAYMASSVPAISKKVRYTMVIFIAALCFGCAVSLIIEKLDTCLRSPDDIAKRVGVRIIGTTTSPRNMDKIMLGQQLTDDYQTIRANLGLIDEQLQKKIIVVTSAGVGDGKTTFSVNLATSFARCGEKTLLIDGDLRKPDIAATLNLSKNLRGLQEVLLEEADCKRAVFRMPSTGLYVLASDRTNNSDALDLLGQPTTAKVIKELCVQYNHVIIDTPPILAFTDALLWAKMADGVILTSFVERTCSSELRETIDRLEQIDADIIGTVVNNVQVKQGYHRYGYGYDGESSARKCKDGVLLLSTDHDDTD